MFIEAIPEGMHARQDGPALGFAFPYWALTQSRYAPLCTRATHSGLSRYHRTVLRMPVAKVSAGASQFAFDLAGVDGVAAVVPGRSLT